MKKLKGHNLGTINLKGSVIISDPCYTEDVWCAGQINNIKQGQWVVESWEAYEDRWDGHMLVIRHKDYKQFVFPKHHVKEITLGIDSGQVGIYDKEEYRNDAIIPKLIEQGVDTPIGILEDDKWYSYACHLGYEIPAKLVGNGVTSASGYGDGIAQLLIDRNTKGEIIRIGVNF